MTRHHLLSRMTRSSLPLPTPLHFRGLSSYAPRLNSFEERWLKLGQAEKEQIAAEYESLQKADWKNLTMDQKKIRKLETG